MIERHAPGEDSGLPTPTVPEGKPTVSPLDRMLPAQLGAYRIQSRLGQGGMGTVYRAWHTRLKRIVALKTLRAEYMDNAPAVARFHREMEAVGKLDHPNLIRATDAGEDHGIHFLAMEYVEGMDAARLSQACGPLPIAEACELVRQAAVGLHCAHEHGLVHRDVKPSNLMVTPGGRVKVLDLGLALLHTAADEVGELTGSNQWMGTADYMAPEQGLDAHAVDIRADIYSLGCTLYKLLAGQAPFGGSDFNTPLKKLDAHAHRPAPPLSRRRLEVPVELAAVVERMMAKAPADRFATPGEAAEALAPFAAGADLSRLVSDAGATSHSGEMPVDISPAVETRASGPPTPALLVPEATPIPPATPNAPRSRRMGWVAAVVLALAGLSAALLLWPRHNSDRPPLPDARQEPAVGVWYNLLEQPPELLLWPPGEVLPGFEQKRQRLHVSCNTKGLLRLGTAPPRTAYKVQIGFRQPQWNGGIGLFAGYAEEAQGSPNMASFQQIMLTQPNPLSGHCSLSRSTGVLHPNAPLSPVLSGRYTEEVGTLAPREYVLEIEVEKTGFLREVRWDGKRMDVLTRPGPPMAPLPLLAPGAFGVAVNQGSAVVTTARWFILSRE